jgi:hypothetical protein
LLTIMALKLGMANPNRMAARHMVTISSTMVKPRWRVPGCRLKMLGVIELSVGK